MARLEPALRLCRLALSLLVVLLLGVPVAAEETGDDLPIQDPSLEISLEKARAYPGQTLTATVTLLVGQIPVRNIQYPVLKGEAYRLGEFAPPRPGSQIRDGREYAAYVFTATLTPLRSGAWRVGPAELACDVLVRGGGAEAFFGGTEPRTVKLRSAAVDLEILPLPALGRPADFSGAIGRFRVSRQAMPGAIRGGDPITVTTRIEGDGDLGTYACPSIQLPGVRAYPPRTRRAPGVLACEQVLLPEGEGDLLLPPARISFFDPASGRYRTADSGPVRVEVTGKGREPAAAQPARAEPPALQPRAEHAGPARIAYALLATLLLLALIAVLVARGRASANGRARTHGASAAEAGSAAATWLAEAKAALAADDPARFHTAVYRALQTRLGAQYGLAAPAVTVEVVDRILRPAGVPDALADGYERLFVACDRARFAPAGNARDNPRDTCRLLEQVLRGG